MRGPIGVAAGRRRKSRVDFFHDGCLGELGVAHRRKEFGELAHSEVDDFLARLIDDGLRSADDQLKVATSFACWRGGYREFSTSGTSTGWCAPEAQHVQAE